MFRLLLILSFTFLSHHLFAQIGIFKTYEDYLDNKVEKEYFGNVSVFHAFGSFKITFRDKDGKKVRIKADHKKFWGYQDEDGYTYRINKKNDPYLMIEEGKICLFTNYSSRISEDGTISFNTNQFVPHFSDGPNGKMIPLNKKKLKKFLAKDFVALSVLKKTRGSLQGLYEFIVQYNKGI